MRGRGGGLLGLVEALLLKLLLRRRGDPGESGVGFLSHSLRLLLLL